MAALDSTQSTFTPQSPKSGYRFLAAVLDGLNDQPLLNVLQDYRRTGRPGYPVDAMWRAYLVKFLLKIRYNNELLERLRGSRKLREVCGFAGEVPSESVLSRFVNRLADHQPLIEQCLAGATSGLRGLVPKVKKTPGKPDRTLPPLGEVVAVDSTLFLSYSNPNRKHLSDPDAKWGLKNSAKTKDGKKEWGWGYKMHLLSDASHGVPLDFIITPANESDSPMLPLVLEKARETYPWLRPKYLLGDKGYDSLSNHECLVKQGITPVIHLRKPREGELHDGIYTETGAPTCMGTVMEYVRTSPETGHHLFRCPPGGCALRAKSNGAIQYCDSGVWENPADNLRVIGVLPRSSRLWKRLYRQRMSIERVFRSLKHSRGLEGHCMRGMRKIKLQATMSVLTFQATVLGRVKAEDYVGMRQMTVKVA